MVAKEFVTDNTIVKMQSFLSMEQYVEALSGETFDTFNPATNRN